MTYYLDKILESSKERVMSDKIANPYKNLRSKIDDLEQTRAFIDKIKKRQKTGLISVIAESKQASPS